MAKVRNSLTWTASESRIREWVGIPTGQDYALEVMFEAVVKKADAHLNNFFKDVNGVDLDPFPRAILEGIGAYMDSIIKNSKVGGGVLQVKTGDLMKSWASAAGSGLNINKIALNDARVFWSAYKLPTNRG